MPNDATLPTGIGADVRRREDYRFLKGKGKYTDDFNLAGQTYAYIIRSPHAHATINGINASAATGADGVGGSGLQTNIDCTGDVDLLDLLAILADFGQPAPASCD